MTTLEALAVPPQITEKTAKVIVIMPAYNAAKTVVDTYKAIPEAWVDEVILVDDGSADETAAVAKTLDLTLIVHPHNAGYGANQKTCYMEALRRDADIVIMLHPDGQYDPSIIPEMITVLQNDEADFVPGFPVPDAGRRAERRYAHLQIPGQPVPDHRRELGTGHQPRRDAHRLPRLQP